MGNATDNTEAIIAALKTAVELPRDGVYWKIQSMLVELETFLHWELHGVYGNFVDADGEEEGDVLEDDNKII